MAAGSEHIAENGSDQLWIQGSAPDGCKEVNWWSTGNKADGPALLGGSSLPHARHIPANPSQPKVLQHSRP